jgi:hypothetical protein
MLLNIHEISDVRQIEIRMPEFLVPNPSSFKDEITIAKLKKYKSPDSDQSMVQLIQ